MPTNIFACPQELRDLPQWVCWRYVDIGAKKPTKVPFDPKSGEKASVTDPSTWADFQTAFNRYSMGGFDGIGFVFTPNDPYSFIDLDDSRFLINGSANPNYDADFQRQLNIFNQLDSYAELSPSGMGLHVIIRGKVPTGRRKSFIEIYSQDRYATMTGNVYGQVKPIADRHTVINSIWQQMGGTESKIIGPNYNESQREDDSIIIERAKNAVNGAKFSSLFSGSWQSHYPSQSEADFALVDMLGFYTKSRAQIARIFRASGLGQRDKSKRNDYVEKMISSSFDRMPPLVDLDGMYNELQEVIKPAVAVSSNGKAADFDSANSGSIPGTASIFPPGLMGEIAQYIYESAPRPVKEVALGASIGLMAGICGKAYNISQTGLNQYVLVLAATGRGKEAAAQGIDTLMSKIKMSVPASVDFIGPAEIASGQALVKHVNKHPCFLSILGEFGLRMHSMSNASANNSETSLRRMLLDLYNKSGHGQVFRGSIYSDKDKNIGNTEAPSFSILGESTPKRFYEILNEDMISEGLLPRFMILEYDGPRVPENPKKGVEPSFQLLNKLSTLSANCLSVMHAKQKPVPINIAPDADIELKRFDKHCDERINKNEDGPIVELWNRAHIKTLKLAGLVAVGVNPFLPVVTIDLVHWAIRMVQADIKALGEKFEKGEIGHHSSENKQAEHLKKVVKTYYQSEWKALEPYKVNKALFDNGIIPYAYISQRLVSQMAFKSDRLGSTQAIKRAIQLMLDSDTLREIGRAQLQDKYGTAQRAFVANKILFKD